MVSARRSAAQRTAGGSSGRRRPDAPRQRRVGGRGDSRHPGFSTSPARRTWRHPGPARSRTLPRTHSAPITCSRPSSWPVEPCRILVVSSGQIYQSSDDPIDEDAPLAPSNPYGLSKLAQDQLALNVARDERLDVVVARPFNHIGPRPGSRLRRLELRSSDRPDRTRSRAADDPRRQPRSPSRHH